jgi:hypothetical protein
MHAKLKYNKKPWVMSGAFDPYGIYMQENRG